MCLVKFSTWAIVSVGLWATTSPASPASPAQAQYEAFLYKNGVYSALSAPGGSFTFAAAINDSDAIVGWYADQEFNNTYGFLYANGTYTNINDPLAPLSDPRGSLRGTTLSGINNNGQIIGNYCAGVSECDDHGFLYRDGEYTEIDDPLASGPGGNSWVSGISDSGVIVGTFIDGVDTTITGPGGPEEFPNGIPQAFVYENGIFTTLSVPNEAVTEMGGITPSGIVFGGYCNDAPSCNNPSGFTYSNGQLEALNISFPGADNTSVESMNSNGDAAGTECATRLGNCPKGFTYINGVYAELAFPGGLQIQSAAINDLGDVAGSVTLGAIVPEPASWVLMLLGAGGVGAVLRRRWQNGVGPIA